MVLNPQVLNKNRESDIKVEDTKDDNEEIKRLLEKNLELTKEIHTMSKKVNRFVLSRQVFGVIKTLIIVAPIIIAIIYVPRFIEAFRKNPEIIFENTVVDSWLDGIVDAASEKVDPSKIDMSNVDLNQIDVNKLSPEVVKELQKQLSK